MLSWTTDYLTKHDDEHPRLSAEWLICAATGYSRIEVYMNIDKPLTADELKIMHDGVLRRGKGEPLQYVTGEMPFRHIILKCAPEVLIPRPETEILVDEALKCIDDLRLAHKDPIHVLEVGCGTGCISCSIASERPFTRVVATDISPYATALARRNVSALGLDERVDIVDCDLVSGVDSEMEGIFDLLISNPPYIPTQVMEELPGEVVGFEPHLALDGGDDGLDIFRRLVDVAPRMLCPGGTLMVELFETKLEAAAEIIRNSQGWTEPYIVEDLTHRPRHLVASTKPL